MKKVVTIIIMILSIANAIVITVMAENSTPIIYDHRLQLTLPGTWMKNGNTWENNSSSTGGVLAIDKLTCVGATAQMMSDDRGHYTDLLVDYYKKQKALKEVNKIYSFDYDDTPTTFVSYKDAKYGITQYFVPIWDEEIVYVLIYANLLSDNPMLEFVNIASTAKLIDVSLPTILFRGIKWGRSCAEVLNDLSSTGLKWKNGSVETGRKIKAQASGEWSDYYDKDCLYHIASASSEITVAGYTVKSIDLYFAMTEDEKGIIPKDLDHTSFYMAKYTISPINMDAVFDDLRAKLTKLYGEPDDTFSEGWMIKYNYCYWYGADNTMIILVDDDNYKDIHINYIWRDGEKLMERANYLQQ